MKEVKHCGENAEIHVDTKEKIIAMRRSVAELCGNQ
jgi:hypothetical protein